MAENAIKTVVDTFNSVTSAIASGATAATLLVDKPSIVEIKGYLQPFPYGRLGEKSMAARFAKKVDPSIEIKPDQPYGEIWLGSTHKNGPSILLTPDIHKGTSLRTLVGADPEFYLGSALLGNEEMQSMYKNDLPFLFKILSFDKALPLQAHPDPKLGEKLRKIEIKQQGMNSDFVDDNGKPEVSVALSDFTAFVGFRPPQDIAAFLESVLEFANLFSGPQKEKLSSAASNNSDKALVKEAIQSLFGTAIALSKSDAKRMILDITEKLEGQGAKAAFGESKDADALAKVWRTNLKVYGEEDVGLIITTFLMNLVQLKPGEGCWILADDIHAYVEGDVIECMANSDNMVCHGLGETDQGGKKTFVDMLSYRHLPASKLTLSYTDAWDRGLSGRTRFYDVPIREFDLYNTTLTPSAKSESMQLKGPQTFVVTQGTVKATVGEESVTLGTGHTAFVRANAKLELELVDGSEGVVWSAFCE